jgi:replicative DNA helicase
LQLDVCVVLLHQLNRSVETRGGDKRPKLSDLRDSGNVEQDAQVVIFLYRPDYYGITEDDQGSTIGAVDVIVEKNSNGPTETVRLRFVGETASVHGDAPQWNPRDIPKPDNRTEPTRDADEVAPF